MGTGLGAEPVGVDVGAGAVGVGVVGGVVSLHTPATHCPSEPQESSSIWPSQSSSSRLQISGVGVPGTQSAALQVGLSRTHQP